MKLSAILPVFGKTPQNELKPNQSVNSNNPEPRSLTRRGSDAVSSGKKIIVRRAKAVAKEGIRMIRRGSSKKLLGDDADTDKSDKSTRDKHKVVIRPDGRAVIKAMQSENNVVKKFKLRSNSIVVNPDAMGALQAAEAEFKNIEMEAIARKKGLITPNNPLYRKWKLFMLVLAVWESFYAPFNWSMPQKTDPFSVWKIFEHIVDFIFMIDFFLMLFVARKDKKTGLVVTSRKKLWKRYLKGTFFIDLLTCVPLDKIVGWSMGKADGGSWAGSPMNEMEIRQWYKRFRLLRVYRLAMIYKVIDGMDHTRITWFFYSAASQYMRLLMIVVLLVFVIHLMGCVWFSIGWVGLQKGWNYWRIKEECDVRYSTNDLTALFLNDSFVPTEVNHSTIRTDASDQLTTAECMEREWKDGGMNPERLWAEYTSSLLTSLYLLLTQENLSPGTMIEKISQIGYLASGILVTSAIYGETHAKVNSIMSRSSAYQRKMEVVYDGMERLKLPKNLQTRIFYYYEYLFKEHGTLDGSVIGFVPEVSVKLQAEIYLWQRFNLVHAVPFFQNVDPVVLQEIVMKMEVEVYLPGDYVVSKGDYGDCMYFIYTGQCEVLVPLSAKETAARTKALLDKEANGSRRKSSVQQIGQLLRRGSGLGGMGSNINDPNAIKIIEEVDEEVHPGKDGAPGQRLSIKKSVTRPARKSGGSLVQILNKGQEESQKPKTKSYKVVATLNAGQYFGEVALVLHAKRTASIRSKACCEVCVLTTEIYNSVAESYPKDAEYMKSIILAKYSTQLKSQTSKQDDDDEKGSRSDSDESGDEDGKEREDDVSKERPCLDKRQESATSTVPSTPSKNSRNNSLLSVQGPNSPLTQLKNTANNFKADMELINFACDKIFQEELKLTETIGSLQRRLIRVSESLKGEAS